MCKFGVLQIIFGYYRNIQLVLYMNTAFELCTLYALYVCAYLMTSRKTNISLMVTLTSEAVRGRSRPAEANINIDVTLQVHLEFSQVAGFM